MTKMIRLQLVVVLMASLVCIAASAQSSGAATYKAKCQNCHGASGMADTVTGRALKIRPITDPEIVKIPEGVMFDNVKTGIRGKMIPYKDQLTDKQIKDVVAYFRSSMK